MSLWDHISDDAYISFRYVERWVAGQGLTFNPGEQVEGFSNPLWVGILALSRFLLPNVAIVDAARVLGFAASVISFLAMAVAVKLSSPGRQSVAFLYAAVILACTPGFHVYATAGLETPVFGMLVTVAVLFSLAETLPPHRAGVRGGDPGFAARLGAALCLGFAAVCRPEAALYGFLWWLFTRGPRQLRIAMGKRLTIPPERALTPVAHAIECRIYAEDPDAGFLPAPGLVRALSIPGGPGIRDDRGVAPGFDIPVFYDSMISKLIVWGDSRDEAIARLRRVLSEYRVVGVKTTVPFFQWLVDQPEFVEARFDTTYLDRVLAERKGEPFVSPSKNDEEDAVVAAAIAAWLRTHRAAAAAPERRSVWRQAARRDGLRG